MPGWGQCLQTQAESASRSKSACLRKDGLSLQPPALPGGGCRREPPKYQLLHAPHLLCGVQVALLPPFYKETPPRWRLHFYTGQHPSPGDDRGKPAEAAVCAEVWWPAEAVGEGGR